MYVQESSKYGLFFTDCFRPFLDSDYTRLCMILEVVNFRVSMPPDLPEFALLL